jgi:hypothetical protein
MLSSKMFTCDSTPLNPWGLVGVEDLNSFNYTNFNGAGNYLIALNASLLNLSNQDFTLEWFMRVPDNTTLRYIGDLGPSSCGTATNNFRGFHFGLSSGTFNFSMVYSATQGLNMGAGWTLGPVNTWQHFALVRIGSNFRAYVNGQLKGSVTSTISQRGTLTSDYLGIGGFDTAGRGIPARYWFKGDLSNFRLVIGTGLYNSNFVTPSTPVTLAVIPNTKLLICASNSHIDKSGTYSSLITSAVPPTIF